MVGKILLGIQGNKRFLSENSSQKERLSYFRSSVFQKTRRNDREITEDRKVAILAKFGRQTNIHRFSMNMGFQPYENKTIRISESEAL